MPDSKNRISSTGWMSIFASALIIALCILAVILEGWQSAVAVLIGGVLGFSIALPFYALFSGDFDAR